MCMYVLYYKAAHFEHMKKYKVIEGKIPHCSLLTILIIITYKQKSFKGMISTVIIT